MKAKKIRAFTLVELLVVMVISGIVIAITYQIYFIANKQFMQYKKGNEKVTQEVILRGLLNNDFFQSESVIRKSENNIEMQLADEKINYEWRDEFIIRVTNASRDTFFLPVSLVELKFRNSSQDISAGLIDALKIISENGDEEKYFCFFKEYSADVLMQNTHERN